MTTGTRKSIKREVADLQIAQRMCQLGARAQAIKELTQLSDSKISSIYKEVLGGPSPKGLLPYSINWYVTWKANIHSSLYYSIYVSIYQHSLNQENFEAKVLADAYQLYCENCYAAGEDPELSFTRAWMLQKFISTGQIISVECENCLGQFLARSDDNNNHYMCGICNPPPRAGILAN